MAKGINKCKTSVCNFLQYYLRSERIEQPPIRTNLSSTRRRASIKEASKGLSSAKIIKIELKLPVPVRRFQQFLKSATFLQYQKMAPTPAMNTHHQVIRLHFSRKHALKGLKLWK